MPAQFENAAEGYLWTEQFARIDRGGYDPRRERLARMRTLLAHLEDPHRGLRLIHVTGSKGKGSTATFIAAILQEAGYRVGLYTSPHVEQYGERIRVNGTEPDNVAMTSRFERLRTLIRTHYATDPTRLPTSFELLTAIALLTFAEEGADRAVIEVGIGGRSDATNVITPIASVITPVELEHTRLLGTTLRAVAAEKAGIIKRGRPVFLSAQQPEAEHVIERVAALRGAPVFKLRDLVMSVESTVAEDRLLVEMGRTEGGRIRTRLRTMLPVQSWNAALAAAVCMRLERRCTTVAIEQGLAQAVLRARGELFRLPLRVMLDGAHTVQSVRAVAEAAALIEPDPELRHLLFGAGEEKDGSALLAALRGAFASAVVTRAGTFKPSDPHRLRSAAAELDYGVYLEEDPEQALDRSIALAGPRALIVVTGSFYLVGRIRSLLRSRTGRT